MQGIPGPYADGETVIRNRHRAKAPSPGSPPHPRLSLLQHLAEQRQHLVDLQNDDRALAVLQVPLVDQPRLPADGRSSPRIPPRPGKRWRCSGTSTRCPAPCSGTARSPWGSPRCGPADFAPCGPGISTGRRQRSAPSLCTRNSASRRSPAVPTMHGYPSSRARLIRRAISSVNWIISFPPARLASPTGRIRRSFLTVGLSPIITIHPDGSEAPGDTMSPTVTRGTANDD